MSCIYFCVCILFFAVSFTNPVHAKQLRANLQARDLAEAKLISEIFNDIPILQQQSSEERQKIKKKKNDVNTVNYSFARTVKPVPNTIPECTSGNEFLSDGGHWEMSDMVKDKFLYAEFYAEKKRPHCRVDEYNDPYVWAANCSMPVLKTKETKRTKVAIAGDSLTGQINAASHHLPNIGIDIDKKFGSNPMLTTVHYESDRCTQCDSKLQALLHDIQVEFYTEEEFLEELSGYDYIFYNEFAHYVGPFMTGAPTLTLKGNPRPLRAYYDEELGEGNVTTAEMMKDQLSFFRRQMRRKAQLLRDHLPNTKVYFRTSPPHAYKELYPDMQRGELYPGPAKEFSYNECEHREDQEDPWFGAFCYSVINDIARNAFLAYGHEILETAAPMSQRTDAHPCRDNGNMMGDCLHFCMPGPPNVMLAAIVTEVLARENEKAQ